MIRPRKRNVVASLWADAFLLGLEVPAVIGLRLAKMALNDPRTATECRLMFTEKANAARDAQSAAMKALLIGAGVNAPAEVVRLYRRRVRANLRRLTKRR